MKYKVTTSKSNCHTMNEYVEHLVNMLVKDITGEDEYVFNPANKASDTLWTGLLSNRFSFWLETTSLTITVQSDTLLATWEMYSKPTHTGLNLKQIVELGANNTSVSTFCLNEDDVNAYVTSGKLCLHFDTTVIERYDDVKLGNLEFGIPRGWFNSDGPITLTEAKRNELILAVLGRPLNKERKEKLMVNLSPPPAEKSKFMITITKDNRTGHAVNTYIGAEDVIDKDAVMRCIAEIMAV